MGVTQDEKCMVVSQVCLHSQHLLFWNIGVYRRQPGMLARSTPSVPDYSIQGSVYMCVWVWLFMDFIKKFGHFVCIGIPICDIRAPVMVPIWEIVWFEKLKSFGTNEVTFVCRDRMTGGLSRLWQWCAIYIYRESNLFHSGAYLVWSHLIYIHIDLSYVKFTALPYKKHN